jgi:dTDP-4-amino-4,6-dideoxygalactose transaminase
LISKRKGLYSQAEEFYQVALTLPMHMYLTDEDVKEVVWLIGEAVNGN